MILAPASGLYEFDPLCMAHIPAALQAHLQWVVWQAGDRIAKRTGQRSGLEKKPIDPKTNPPRLAASDNPASWGAFRQCVEALPPLLALWQQQAPKNYRGGGIGFVFSKRGAENEGEKPTDPYTGIDLDHCRAPETGAIAPWAQQIITFLNSYSEVSPSGTGVKIFVQATLPGGGVNKHFIEMYDRGRFFTVTGWHIPGTPSTIEPRQSHIEALYAVHDLLDKGLQRHSERLSLLFAGHWEQVQPAPGYSTYRSQSEADLAFCVLLARGGATAEQIDTLMRLSGLYRPKWDDKHGSQTYGVLTLAKAMGRGDGVHQHVHPFQNTTQQQHNEQRRPPAAIARSTSMGVPSSLSRIHTAGISYHCSSRALETLCR
jgi:putative DNA primase/helicase